MTEIGKKFSRQREMIYEQVKNYPNHPTADEVCNALKKDCPNLSLGTVYRNLNLLSDMGLLTKIHLGEKDRFDGNTTPHCHFFCEICGKVFDVEDSGINGIEERVLAGTGHLVKQVCVNFRGICRNCSHEKT